MRRGPVPEDRRPSRADSSPLCSFAHRRLLAGSTLGKRGRTIARVAGVETVEHFDEPVTRDDEHVEPLFFVVRVERVDACELVVRRVQVTDVAQRLAPALAREYF